MTFTDIDLEHLLALAQMEIKSIQPASPVGKRKVSQPRKWRNGRGTQRTNRVKQPIMLPKVLAKIVPRPGLVPSGGQANRLYSTSYRP